MKPFYIKRRTYAEVEQAITDHLNRSCVLLTPITEVKTHLKRSVAVMYFAKLRKVN